MEDSILKDFTEYRVYKIYLKVQIKNNYIKRFLL